MRLTTARFYSPSGQAISDHGVTPNRTIHVMAHSESASSGLPPTDADPVLVAAKEIAREVVLEARARP